MAQPLEEYALVGDCHSAALVSREGSLDWLCLPRFDSPACFAALLGTADHGRWLITARAPRAIRSAYRGESLILETEFETESGSATLIDFMPPRETGASAQAAEPELVRIVVGRRGTVAMRLEFILRTDYGSLVPWVRRTAGGMQAVAGPDALTLETPLELVNRDFRTTAEFSVAAGQRVASALRWRPSHLDPSPPRDPERLLAETEAFWRGWSGRCRYDGPWREVVLRSLMTLKALTYGPTGGIVAAPTTSLPEQLGGVRNWDYRYCWLRDATFTLLALLNTGYVDEARAWREWLVRAAAGKPSQMQILYGLSGERRLSEFELDWLPGYADSRPVRIGNAAHTQFQLDVFGEVLDALHQARRVGLPRDGEAWRVERALVDFLESAWREPDEGIWEVRGPRRHFTHSKVMAWVAVDRMIKTVEQFGQEGPLARWRALRSQIHDDVCRHGFDPGRNSFVQHYGSNDLDASLLLIPLVGFLPANDPRVVGTRAAIQRELVEEGFVMRYRSRQDLDGLPPGEGAFLPCTFWLVDNLALAGETRQAAALFEQVLSVAGEAALLAEEYDVRARRMIGNFPQAFSHVALVNSALHLAGAHAPAARRHEA